MANDFFDDLDELDFFGELEQMRDEPEEGDFWAEVMETTAPRNGWLRLFPNLFGYRDKNERYAVLADATNQIGWCILIRNLANDIREEHWKNGPYRYGEAVQSRVPFATFDEACIYAEKILKKRGEQWMNR